jgi:hypothetical protein
MSRIFSGNDWYQEIDLGSQSEKDISNLFKSHAPSLFPGIEAFEFEHVLKTGGRTTRADLCLINNSLNRWYIVEVEKSSHDYHDHILPQLRRFKSAIYDDDLIKRFVANNGARVTSAMEKLMLENPPGFLVVVDFNKKNEWRRPLKSERVSLLELRLFRNDEFNRHMIHIEGELPNQPTSLLSICRLKEGGNNCTQLILSNPSSIPASITKIPIVYNGIEGEWTIIRNSRETIIFIYRKVVLGLKFELHAEDGSYVLKDS